MSIFQKETTTQATTQYILNDLIGFFLDNLAFLVTLKFEEWIPISENRLNKKVFTFLKNIVLCRNYFDERIFLEYLEHILEKQCSCHLYFSLRTERLFSGLFADRILQNRVNETNLPNILQYLCFEIKYSKIN